MMYFQYVTNLAPLWDLSPELSSHECHSFGKRPISLIDCYSGIKKTISEDYIHLDGSVHTPKARSMKFTFSILLDP